MSAYRTEADLLITLVHEGAQLIGGAWVGAQTGDTFPVVNPATGETISAVPRSGRAEARTAIDAAEDALPGWRKRTARERSDVLLTLTEVITERRHDLAHLMTLEQGKPLAEAEVEISQTISFFRWYSEESRRLNGEVIPPDRPSRRLSTVRQPIGVVGAITPWNFPTSMVARKVAPALAAGCTVVLKPAEDTPLSALALGELLAAQSASTVKRLSLELGGNAPFIVFDDADLEAAVDGALQSRFRNAGQTCVAANRIYVQRGIHDDFVEALGKRLAAFRVGAGTDPGVSIGPLINAGAATKVQRLLNDAVDSGARIIKEAALPMQHETFVQPRLVTDVSDMMLIAREEIFGPIAAVLPFNDETEVIERANGTPYGLVAYFYTADRRRQVRVSEALDFGMVGINECLVAYEGAPFGGMKESGFGREGSHHGIEEYTELKYVCEGGLA